MAYTAPLARALPASRTWDEMHAEISAEHALFRARLAIAERRFSRALTKGESNG